MTKNNVMFYSGYGLKMILLLVWMTGIINIGDKFKFVLIDRIILGSLFLILFFEYLTTMFEMFEKIKKELTDNVK